MVDRIFGAAPPEALRAVPLDGLVAIFDRRSMQTHLVAPPMPEILAALTDDPCGAATLAARLAKDFDMGDAEDVIALLDERLAELAAMGLVDVA